MRIEFYWKDTGDVLPDGVTNDLAVTNQGVMQITDVVIPDNQSMETYQIVKKWEVIGWRVVEDQAQGESNETV